MRGCLLYTSTHFERGNALISTNNNNVTVEFKASQLEKELITTDREELKKLIARQRQQSQEPEPVFEPAASEPAAETVTWSEPETKPAAASLPKETEAPTRELLEGTPDDEIQVVESEGDEVEIALTLSLIHI